MHDGERTLPDNSMIVFPSSLYDGNRHDTSQLPVLLAGGGGDTIKGNQILDYSRDRNRKLCRLYRSFMQRKGVNTSRFGDADQPLGNINV